MTDKYVFHIKQAFNAKQDPDLFTQYTAISTLLAGHPIGDCTATIEKLSAEIARAGVGEKWRFTVEKWEGE